MKNQSLKRMAYQVIGQVVAPERLDADHTAAIDRTTELLLLFEHAHVPPGESEIARRRTSGRAGPDHQDVVCFRH
jgi:hypothetical protein